MVSYVFIDARVGNINTQLVGLAPNSITVILDPFQAGISQIAETLALQSQVQSIHVVSHGADGTLYLGDTAVNIDNLGDNRSELAVIGSALSAGADILLYGCNVAATDTGRRFIEALAAYTQAHVAASTDTTGAAALGGNWQLEAATGPIHSRTLSAEGYAGLLGEFRVNTTTANDQTGPAVDTLSDGSFVVVWESDLQDGSGLGVYAQRYNAGGTALGTEFRVNSVTANDQTGPAVAALSNGDFVITWESVAQDGSGLGVYAQRYNLLGAPQGVAFKVNTTTLNDQDSPTITSLENDDFVITWNSLNQDGSGYGVYAQRYNAAGVAQGAEFRINTTTANDQVSPEIAALSSGGFVVVWTSGAAGATDVFAQRFSATGVAQGAQFRVNTTTASDQDSPVITELSSGDFAVAWHSLNQDGGGLGVYAQRFSSTGVAQGVEFRVNSTTADDQDSPSITALDDGGFVVTWNSLSQDGSGLGVYGQRFDATGVVQGAEFRVNATTASDQDSSAVTALDNGGFLVTWNSLGQDGSLYGVYAQRFDAAGNPASVDRDYNGDGKGDILWHNTNGSVAVWQMDGFTQTAGAIVGSATTDWKIADGSGDYDGNGKSDLLWFNDNGNVAIWQMDGLTVAGGLTFSSVSPGWKIADGAGDYNRDGKSDILLRHDNGNVGMWLMDGLAIASGSTFSNASTDWKIADGAGDYNGDGKSDILWRNDNGNVAIWLMDGFTQTAGAIVSSATTDWKIADGSGDYNGDGKSDILFHNDNGNVAIWQMDGMNINGASTFSNTSPGWKIADGSGDHNGDGRSDILLHHANGNVGMWLMDGMVIATGSTFSNASTDWSIVG